MANMISNNHSGGSSSNNSSGNTYGSYNNSAADSGHSSGEAAQLRDVCNMLNSGGAAGYQIPTGGCAYDHIIALMRGLDLQDDGIVLNSKIKTIETDFCNIVRDESMLWYVFARPSVRPIDD